MRNGWWWLGLAALLFAPVRPALANCLACNDQMWCAPAPTGATLCLGAGDWCAMAGRCGTRRPVLDGYAMLQVTLLEGGAVADAAPARVHRGFGPLSVGDHARRAGGGARLRFSAVGEFDGAAGAFRSPAGDGFVLRRERDGRGARVTVRVLEGERAGRLLADERLDEHDVLRVRVPFDGRECVLVVQAPTLPEHEARERVTRCRREIARAMPMAGRQASGEVPFELRALDE